MELKWSEPIVLDEGDRTRVILQFAQYKGRALMKFAEQWCYDYDDTDDDSRWKWNKSQISMVAESAIEVIKKLKEFFDKFDISEIEDFMVNKQQMSGTEEKANNLEKGNKRF